MCITIKNGDIEMVEREGMSSIINPVRLAMIIEDRGLDQMMDSENMARAATAEYAVANQDDVLFNTKHIDETVLVRRLGALT